MKLRKGLARLLATIMLIGNLSTGALAATPADFSDFPTGWSAGALTNAVENNLLQGMDGKIDPDGLLTRAQMAAILTRALGADTQASIESYTDVSKTAWYYDAVSKAVAANLLTGSENQMYPERSATRQEAFVVLSRILKLGDNPSGLHTFSDQNAVADWAKGPLGALAAAGHIQGAEGQINPSRSITRAEFAQVLMKVFGTYLSTPKEYTANADGNVIVNTANVSLKDMTVAGDLILADGIGTGDATLEHVTVNGRLIIRGGGSQSIHITNSQVGGSTILDNPNGETRVVLSGSPVGAVHIYSNAILNGDIENVVLANTSRLQVQAGTIQRITVSAGAEGSSIAVSEGATVTAAAIEAKGASITGLGHVGTIEANADNIQISVSQATVIAREGVTGVTAGGNAVEGGSSVTIQSSESSTENKTQATTPSKSSSSGGSSGGSSSGGGSSDDSGSSKNKFAGGSGTKTSPWQIATAHQLNLVRNHLDGHFVLIQDIDLSAYSNWTPIGKFVSLSEEESETPNPAYSFTGTLDGNGKTISNLKIDQRSQLGDADMSGTGLFGGISGNGSIYNLKVQNITVSGKIGTGGVIGMSLTDGKVDGITLLGTNTITGSSMVGGIIGGGTSDISNCSAKADIIMNGDYGQGAGVLAGGMENCSIFNCQATGGSVTATGTGITGLGGLSGCALDSKEVSGCTVDGVTISAPEGATMVGGLLGFSGMITEGDFTTEHEGFTLIKNCTANTDITAANGAARIGGIVGSGFFMPAHTAYYPTPAAMKIVNCTAEGTIEGGSVAGSIIGYAFRNSTLTSCTGNIASLEQVGGADAAEAVGLDQLAVLHSVTDMLAASQDVTENDSSDASLLYANETPEFDGGSGTEEEPWGISTPEQLNAIRNHLNGHFVLKDNINLTEYENWVPIGKFSPLSEEEAETPDPLYAFTGSLNGAGKTISNLSIDRSSELSDTEMSGTGLFGGISGDASIYNLTVENITVTGKVGTGGIIGMSLTEGRVDNITLSGTNTITGTNMVGGIIGGGTSDIRNCSAQADIIMNGDNGQGAGVLAGGMEDCSIIGCEVTGGSVTATGSGITGLGGLSGCALDSAEVTDCTVSGVTISVPEGATMAGGLLGFAGVVTEGDFTTEQEGFTLIKNCTADVSITAENNTSCIGGIVGSGFYMSAYASYYPAPASIHIVDCTASGSISGGSLAGSIIGYAYQNSAVTSCTGNIASLQQVGGMAAAEAVALADVN